MPRWLKVVLISLLVVITLLGSCALYIYHNLDELKQLALKELNKQLKAELSAKAIGVTFWNTFPDVSLSFNQISISDPLRKNEKLLVAEQLFMGFDFYDLLNKKYKIKLLALDNATIALFVNRQGKGNYDIVKETPGGEKGKKNATFSFELSKLSLRNVTLSYVNGKEEVSVHFLLDDAKFSGAFDAQKFTLAAMVEGNVKQMKFGGLNLLANKKLSLNTSIQVNNKDEIYSIGKTDCRIDDLDLQVAGDIQQLRAEMDIDIRFAAKAITIQNLLSLLPVKLPEQVTAYKSEGKVFFNGTVKGIQSASAMPEILVNFGIEHGSLSDPATGIKLEHIALKGAYNNGAAHSLKTSQLSLSKIEASLQNQKLHGNVLLKNFEELQLTMDLTGAADLAVLTRFLKPGQVEEAAGNVDFTLNLEGRQQNKTWNWTSPMNLGLFKANISRLKLKHFDEAFTNAVLDVKLNKEQLFINQLELTIDKTSLSLKGNVNGMMAYLLGQDQKVSGSFELQSDKAWLENLAIYTAAPAEEGEQARAFVYDLSFNINVKQFYYKHFAAEQLQFKARLEPGNISFSDVSMLTNGGSLKGSGAFITEANRYALKTQTIASNLNMNELLKQFDNFGQAEITSKNLFGNLTATTDLLVVWDAKFNLVENSLLMVSDLSIKNGQLLNYEPLKALSRFVDVNELNNLRFSELKNTLSIKNKVLTIPNMDIKNNVLNLTLSGTHTFENYLDYRVKLSLSELLSKKRKPRADEFGEEDEKTNGLNLYLTVKGEADNLKFVYDKKAVKAKMGEDLKKERQSVKELFKQELGIRKDSTLKKTEKKTDNDELEFEN